MAEFTPQSPPAANFYYSFFLTKGILIEEDSSTTTKLFYFLVEDSISICYLFYEKDSSFRILKLLF